MVSFLTSVMTDFEGTCLFYHFDIFQSKSSSKVEWTGMLNFCLNAAGWRRWMKFCKPAPTWCRWMKLPTACKQKLSSHIFSILLDDFDMWMAGPMMAYRCDVTSVQAAHVACQPTIFCLLLFSAIPCFIYFATSFSPSWQINICSLTQWTITRQLVICLPRLLGRHCHLLGKMLVW